MEFKDLNIKNRYRSADTSNIGRDFIEKVLKHSFFGQSEMDVSSQPRQT